MTVSPTAVAFSDTEVGAFQTATLNIANTGPTVLTGTVTAMPPFSVVSGSAFLLFPGESEEVAMRFAPSESGLYEGILAISGDVSLSVSMTATGISAGGEGEGEGEMPNLYAVRDDVDSQFEMFTADFGISEADFDNDGIDDEFTLALLYAVCSRKLEDDLRNATLNAFAINLMNLEAEAQFDSLDEYKLGLAALLLLSTDMQTATKEVLAGQDIMLMNTYEVVTVINGVPMPSTIEGVKLAEDYEAFAGLIKANDEPYSATGDLDDDGTTNLAEYQNIVARGGTAADFATSANDSTSDGTQIPGEGEGEGEGPTPGCGALWTNGAPVSGGVGDLALLTLVVGAIHFRRGRWTTQG